MVAKPRWTKFLNFAVRISLATLVGILYEDYWFDRNHLLGHLYYLNFHKVRGEEVEDKYQKAFNVTYPLQLRIALNAMTAMFLWYINIHKKFFRPTCLFDILKWTMYMTFVFIFVQQPTRFILDIFWQVFGHHVCFNIFILFAMNVIIFVKFKWRKSD